ncbi:MAG: type II secretion system F family protein, partial [Anaerolineae bacterium]|nr:type II secretion system F family protein [Anaerolineae bacterium]
MAFVVPQFADMYAGFGSELPALTQALIDASDVFLSIWWLVLLALVGAVIGLRQTLFRFTKSLQLR